jgi:hypothetical protein
MAFEIPGKPSQWHSSALMASVHRVVRLDKQDKPFQTRVIIFSLALLLGSIVGALVVHVPLTYLVLGLGGVVFAFLLVFKIEIAIMLAILLRNQLEDLNYMGGDTPMHPNGLMGIAIIAGAAVFFLFSRRDLRRLRAICPFLIFTAISFVSLVWAGQYRMDGLTVALKLLTALAIYAVLLYKLDSIRKISWLVGAIVVAQLWRTAKGLVEMSLGIGGDPHMAGMVRIGDSGEAAILAMILAFCVVQLLDARTARRRLLWGIVTSFLAIGLFLSYGRGGWIGFGVALVVIGLLQHRKLLVVLPVILALVIMFVPTVSERFSDIDLQHLDDSDSNTLAGRVEVWQAAAEIYWMHPLLGVGYGVGRYRAAEYLGQGAGAIHNDYLGVLAGTGLIGLAAFLLWQGQWFVELLRARYTAQSAYEKTLALAVFVLFFVSLVVRVSDNVLESTEKLYPLVALVAATLALPRISAKEEVRG